MKLGFTKTQIDNVISSIRAIPPNTQFDITAVPSLDVMALLNNATAQGIDVNSLGLPQSVLNANIGSGVFHAAGGLINGPGGPKDDLIPAMLSAGEYVQPATVVDHYGLGFMEALRQKRVKVGGDGAALPGFADGGLISANIHLLLSDTIAAEIAAGTRAFGRTAPWLPTAAGSLIPASLRTPAGGGNVNLSGVRGSNEQVVQQVFQQMFGWGTGPEWDAARQVIMMESGFDNTAQNPTSTAYGIFQFLDGVWGGYGVSKTSDPTLQAVGGARYIRARYGDPIGALAHERAYHWYDQGGYISPGVTPVVNATGRPEMVLPPGLTETLQQINAMVQGGGIGSQPASAPVNVTQNITAAQTHSPEHIAALASAGIQWTLMTSRSG
jgi:hypothetical protein